MKWKKLTVILMIPLAVIIVWITTNVTSNADGLASLKPGSVDDPIVTKSYVDEQIQTLLANEWTKMKQDILKEQENKEQSALSLKVEKLEKGHTLYAGAGSEFIVRSGKTIAVSSTVDGIPDLTAGVDVAPGKAVANNHLLLFPREGRGIKPDPKDNAEIFVMIRGKYLIVKD